MKKLYTNRLDKIATFLETHIFTKNMAFDFSNWHQTRMREGWCATWLLAEDEVEPDPECGTSACAIGWCPVAFPRSWELVGGLPRLKKGSTNHVECDGTAFFGVEGGEFCHLFVPQDQRQKFVPKGERLIRLSNGVKAKAVAKNIRQFLRYKLQEAKKLKRI